MRQRQQRVASAGGARGSCGGAGLLALAWQATGALALRLAHGLAGLWLGRWARARVCECVCVFLRERKLQQKEIN